MVLIELIDAEKGFKMITFNDLIEKTEYSMVHKCLMNHYKTMKKDSIKKFQDFYEKLLYIAPEPNPKNMYIYINAFKSDGNDDLIHQDNFDENDSELDFDVSGRDDDYYGYSLVACRFESWLGFYIDDNTLLKMTPPNIIAHCLWEMTFFGFEQSKDEKEN